MPRYLPTTYTQFIRTNAARTGATDFAIGSFVELEDLDLVEKFNSDIQIDEYAPGFTAFAGNGGGEFFAFDDKGVVYVIPLIGMSKESAIKLADSWCEFSARVEWDVDKQT